MITSEKKVRPWPTAASAAVERVAPSPLVPYPLPAERLQELAKAVRIRDAKQCVACERPVGRQFVVHPMWPEDYVCYSCSTRGHRCLCCERPCLPECDAHPISRRPGRETFYLCRSCWGCGSTASAQQLQTLLTQSLEFLVHNRSFVVDLQRWFEFAVFDDEDAAVRLADAWPGGCGSGRRLVTLTLTDAHNLAQPLLPGGDGGALQPRNHNNGWSETIVFGKFEPRPSGAFMLRLCRGIPPHLHLGVVPHELLHCYVAHIYGQSTLALDYEEALCNSATQLALEGPLGWELRERIDGDGRAACLFLSLLRQIADFRIRRFLTGDTEATARLPELIDLVRYVGFKKVLEDFAEKPRRSLEQQQQQIFRAPRFAAQ